MPDFSDSYKCPACRHPGAPESDDALSDQFSRGWHVSCPACGFSVSGPQKEFVLQSIIILADHAARLDQMGLG